MSEPDETAGVAPLPVAEEEDRGDRARLGNTRRDRVRAAVRGLTHDIDLRLPPGDVADLRRIRQGALAPAFWRLLVQHVESADLLVEPSREAVRADQEQRWAVIMSALAQSQGFHDGTPLGKALAEADVSEMRVMRLLNATDTPLYDLVRTAIHQLASKGATYDPLDIALLVLDQDAAVHASRGEFVRRRIARSYYRYAQRKDAQ